MLNKVSSSPHIRDSVTTRSIMRDVLIALVPATIWGIYVFGLNALINIVLATGSAVLFEYLYQKYTGKTITISDYSAAVTGLLLGLNLPAGNYFFVPVLGSFFAIVVVKQIYGGIGQNFMNPALAARAFLVVSFAGYMTSWPIPLAEGRFTGIDSVSGATPLSYLKNYEVGETLVEKSLSFFGWIGGSIGEISALALLLGATYLFIRKIISWHIPVSYLLAFSLMITIFGKSPFDISFLASHLFTGGLLLGAFFMATDYSTSPITRSGQIIMGIGCGFLTAIIRMFGGYPEGVSFAILIMNLFVPLLDHYLVPTSFGGRKHE